MNREIKFRAWNKKMKYMSPVRDIVFGETAFIYFPVQSGEDDVSWDGKMIKLEELEIMQYTGLKDKNGKEIYEGDIIKLGCYTHIEYPQGFVGKVIWNKENACFDLYIPNTKERIAHNTSAGMHHCLSNQNNEIIGNIYENI